MTIVCILIGASLYAQTDSLKSVSRKLKYGVNVSYNLTPYIYEALTPSLVMIKERHSFLIGPRVFISRSSPHYKWTRLGLEYTYKIFPNPTSRRFNFYFLFDFDIVMYRSKENVDYYLYSVHYVGTRTSTRYSITNNIGYGFKMTIFKGLYLNHSIGAGIGLFRDDDALDIPDNPTASYSNKGNIISYGTPSILLNVGLGYDF
jgi:hypothetical protein